MRRKNPPETPLYVKLPSPAVDKLDRASAALGVPKKQLVADLVARYVDPDGGPVLGTYSFQAHPAQELPEVLNAKQAGVLLQIDEKQVIELAEKGTLPGKKLGTQWRFSREALVAWLAT